SGVKRVPVLAGLLAITWVAFIAAQTGGTAKPAPKPAVSPAAKPAATPPVQVAAAVQAAPATTGSPAAARALLDQYCVTCHNARLKTANLLLDQLDLAHLGDHVDVAETVVRKVRAGLMPPTNARRPDAAAMQSL